MTLRTAVQAEFNKPRVTVSDITAQEGTVIVFGQREPLPYRYRGTATIYGHVVDVVESVGGIWHVTRSRLAT